MTSSLRHLVLVLGDQLDAESSVFDDFDPARAIFFPRPAAAATAA